MGSTQSIDMTFLRAKYLKRTFTTAELLDPDIFKLDELNELLNICDVDQPQYDLVIIAIQIVCNNVGFAMRLNDDIHTSGTIVHVQDIGNNCNYELSHRYGIIFKDMCIHEYNLKIISTFAETYTFSHANQIKMYFDLKKCRCRT